MRVFIVRNKRRIALLESFIINPFAAGHQTVGEIDWFEVHVLAGIFEPDHAFIGGRLISFDHRPAHFLESPQSLVHIRC